MENRHPSTRNKQFQANTINQIKEQKAPVFRLPFRSLDEANKAIEEFDLIDFRGGEKRLCDSSYAKVHKRFETLLGLLMLALRDHQQLGTNRKGWFDRLVNKFEQTVHFAVDRATSQMRAKLKYDHDVNLIETLHLMDVDPVKYVFMQECRAHDWYYSYSDDGGVYRAGVERERKLIQKAKELGPVYQAIYDRCRSLAFNQYSVVPKEMVEDLKPGEIITVDVGAGRDVVLHDATVIEVYDHEEWAGHVTKRAKLRLCGDDPKAYYTTGRIMIYGHQHHWYAFVDQNA